MKFQRLWLAAILAVSTWAVSGPSTAQVLYQSSFDTPTSDLASTLSTYGLTTGGSVFDGYGGFNTGGVGATSVQSGQLLIVAGPQASVDFGSFAGNLAINFDTTILGSGGSINTGLRVGDYNFLFHPGYPGGAVRVEGPGLPLFNNINTGITFSTSPTLDHMSVAIDATSHMINIGITDGNGGGTYQTSFLDTSYVPGSTLLGLTTAGSGTAMFDNLAVTAPVPEPETYLMLLAGLGPLALAIRRRKLKLAATA
jgi:hypothetical protein